MFIAKVYFANPAIRNLDFGGHCGNAVAIAVSALSKHLADFVAVHTNLASNALSHARNKRAPASSSSSSSSSVIVDSIADRQIQLLKSRRFLRLLINTRRPAGISHVFFQKTNLVRSPLVPLTPSP
jgi:hypothetical protein